MKQSASIAPKGMYVIQIYFSLSDSDYTWILDTACGSHICNSLQRLKNIKGLKRGDLELYNASGESISAEVVGTCMLDLSSGKILVLKDCYYIPKIIKNIISIPLLLKQGYKIRLIENGCSIFFSNKFYDSGYINNNLLILVLNENIFYIERNMKRKRENVNVTYFWHCHLSHISESRINKLYKEKFFDPNDYGLLEIYKSCLMGKLTKTPFS